MMGLRPQRQRGFTLIEIAIVLVVVGLIISGGLMGLSPVLQSNKISQTNQKLDRIEQALVLYVIQNGCLPCPANPANNGTTTAGRAADAAGTNTTGCSSAGNTCTAAHGVVPWINLGLSESDVVDAYGELIDYALSATLNQTSTAMARTPPTTYNTVGSLTVDNASGTQQTAQAAYVLISHGADGSFGYAAVSTTAKIDPNGSVLQDCNRSGHTSCTYGNVYVQSDPQTTAAGATKYFDDIVRFKTTPVIIQSCGSNACGNPA